MRNTAVKALSLNTDPVKVLVELIEAVSHVAVDVVPPVADEDGLVEDGAARAEEAVLAAVEMAVVINLQQKNIEIYCCCSKNIPEDNEVATKISRNCSRDKPTIKIYRKTF